MSRTREILLLLGFCHRGGRELRGEVCISKCTLIRQNKRYLGDHHLATFGWKLASPFKKGLGWVKIDAAEIRRFLRHLQWGEHFESRFPIFGVWGNKELDLLTFSEQKWLNRLQMVQFGCHRQWNPTLTLRLGEFHFPIFSLSLSGVIRIGLQYESTKIGKFKK